MPRSIGLLLRPRALRAASPAHSEHTVPVLGSTGARWPRWGALALVGLVAGCAVERAVRVSVTVDTRVDVVCLTATHETVLETVVDFAMPYDAATLPTPASLTFVAGTEAHDFAITARGELAGSFVGGSTFLSSLANAGTEDVTLAVARCRSRTPGTTRRPAGTFPVLRTPLHMIATDYDADGRDELLAITSDGRLAVLDADVRVPRGSRTVSELINLGATMAQVGDLDEDCRAEVIATSPDGALIVDSDSGRSFAPIGGAVVDVALGRRDPLGPTLLLLAGPGGLTAMERDGTGRSTLDVGPFEHVLAWDADGDGASEVLATGAASLVALSTVDGELVDVSALLPMALGMARGLPAVGDLDGDRDLDLVLVDGAMVRVFERDGADWSDMPSVASVDAAERVAAVDVTGDCRDDVIALDAAGQVVVLSLDSSARLREVASSGTSAALDFAVGDFDGDGTREIAILEAGGAVAVWRP